MAEVMAEDSSDVFEINDFTNASPWESFISSIEDILQQWKLATSNVDHSVTMQHNKTERVTYAGHNFSLTLHVTGEKWLPSNQQPFSQWPPAMQQLVNCNQKFPVKVHHLTRWYGITSFVVLSPVANSDVLMSEAQAKLILSSVAIAIKNTGCNLPIFVQLRELWRQLYHGWCEAGSMQCMFEMVHLKHIPVQLGHLAGLLELFKDKMSCRLPRQPIQLAIKYTYIIKHWQASNNLDISLSPSNADTTPTDKDISMTTLPVGTKEDPLLEIHISTVWPQLSEQLIIDNIHHSQLNPLEAPMWSVTSRMCETCFCKLASRLECFMKLCYYEESMSDILGEGTNKKREVTTVDGVTKALLKITESKFESQISSPLMDTILQPSPSRSRDDHMISHDIIESVIEHLFPLESNEHSCDDTNNMDGPVPIGSFTYHLACCLANAAIMGVHAVAEIWQEVTMELRHCWETAKLIPRIGWEAPTFQHCLLHQKLQMLNCCIKHKKNVTSPQQQQPSNLDNSSNSDDEFFEAQEMLNESIDHMIQSTGDKPSPEWEGRDGVLHQCNDLILVATGEPLCVPITQDVAPMTEDMMAEQETVLAQLGTSEEAGRIRAKMQSGSLLSDMQAFKAANPGCLLEDFVRWYSPRDWIACDETLASHDHSSTSHDCLSTSHDHSSASYDHSSTSHDYLSTSHDHLSASHDHSSTSHDHSSASHDQLCSEDVSIVTTTGDVVADVTINDDVTITDDVTNNNTTDVTKNSNPSGWDEDWAEIEEEPSNASSVTHRYVRGELSQRMQQPGNTWLEAWQMAQPLPVQRQKKLFDHTREAEKVLHYMESLRPLDVSLQLLLTLLVMAVDSIKYKQEQELGTLPCVENLLTDCVQFISSIRHRPSLSELPKLQECIRLLGQAEHQLTVALSIRTKLTNGLEMIGKPVTPAAENEIRAAMVEMMEADELIIDNITTNNTTINEALRGLLTAETAAINAAINIDEIDMELSDRSTKKQHKGLPPEAGREFLLWSTVPSPTHHSLPCPQRLFCVLTPDEFRLAGAFTSDTNVI